jgi:hypothetical protein
MGVGIGSDLTGWISEMLPEGDCSKVRKRLQAVLTGRLRDVRRAKG